MKRKRLKRRSFRIWLSDTFWNMTNSGHRRTVHEDELDDFLARMIWGDEAVDALDDPAGGEGESRGVPPSPTVD